MDSEGDLVLVPVELKTCRSRACSEIGLGLMIPLPKASACITPKEPDLLESAPKHLKPELLRQHQVPTSS
jgi:hypothetical protein